jgi:hypothetical protein
VVDDGFGVALDFDYCGGLAGCLERDAEEQKGAAEDVDLEEGAEVADVAVVVDGGAASVHAEGGAALRDEGVDLSR